MRLWNVLCVYLTENERHTILSCNLTLLFNLE
jgi:hypothetical protein